jgi:hypothetical protein
MTVQSWARFAIPISVYEIGGEGWAATLFVVPPRSEFEP